MNQDFNYKYMALASYGETVPREMEDIYGNTQVYDPYIIQIENVTEPEYSVGTHKDSKIICVTGKNTDLNNECHRKH